MRGSNWKQLQINSIFYILAYITNGQNCASHSWLITFTTDLQTVKLLLNISVLVLIYLYSRHLCRGIYSFRLSVHSYVRSFVPTYFLPSRKWNLGQSFMLMFLKWGIFHQPLIRKHSYLDHRYPGGSASIPWLLSGSVWHRDWPHQIYVGQWPIFYGPVILLHILRTIWWRNIEFGIMDQCDTKIDLVKYMWVNDLYFKVHWFCLSHILSQT